MRGGLVGIYGTDKILASFLRRVFYLCGRRNSSFFWHFMKKKPSHNFLNFAILWFAKETSSFFVEKSAVRPSLFAFLRCEVERR